MDISEKHWQYFGKCPSWVFSWLDRGYAFHLSGSYLILLCIISVDVKGISAGIFHFDAINFPFATYKYLGRDTLELYNTTDWRFKKAEQLNKLWDPRLDPETENISKVYNLVIYCVDM